MSPRTTTATGCRLPQRGSPQLPLGDTHSSINAERLASSPMSSAWSRLWETSLQSAADRGQHGAAQTPSAHGHPPGAPFAQVSAAAHLGNPRQEELALALCPCPPLPLLPSRVGCIVGGRLHPSTRGSEHRRQPRGLQGWAPRCCWGWGGGCPETQWGTDQTKGEGPWWRTPQHINSDSLC